MRHHWNPSQIAILKRGFILTLALFLFVAVFKPVKVNAQEGVECRVSYINFTTDRETSENGSLLHNSNQWVIIDFNLNGYYSGTIDYTVNLTTSMLIPEVTCIGAYYDVTTTRTAVSSGTIYTQTDTYTFTLSNCQHFQLIYHASTSGTGVYMGGSHSLTDSDLTAVDGSGSGSAAVDYTTILNGIAYDITEIYMYMDQIAQDSAGIAETVTNIYNSLNDYQEEDLFVQRFNQIPYYSRTFYSLLLKARYTWVDSDSNALSQVYGYHLTAPSSLYAGNLVWIRKDETIQFVYVSANSSNNQWVFYHSNSATTTTCTTKTAYTDGKIAVKYFTITNSSTSSWYKLNSIQRETDIVPIYLGDPASIPNEVQVLLGNPSNNTLLQRLVSLFTQNNQQNDEMIGKLDTITGNQETINQSINDFNNDFNDAMADIPISETTNQLQQMQSTFTYTNDLISQLWNALGRIQLVIIVALIIALIQIFRGKKT